MKTCPQCHKEYEDNLRFCLDDGAELAAAAQFQHPTEAFTQDAVVVPTEASVIPANENDKVFQPGFQPPPPGKRTSYLLPIVTGLFGIAILFLVGVVGAGWYFLRSKSGDVAAANTRTIEPAPVNTSQANATSNTSTSVDGSNSNEPNGVFNTSANSRPNTKVDAANDRTATTPPPLKTPQPDKTLSKTGDRTLTPEPNVPRTISGGVLNGRAISLPKPPYPPAARAVRASGSVSVQVLIDESGRVISANAVNGHPLLRVAAESAARGARFSPTMLSGQPVKVSGIITYNFVP